MKRLVLLLLPALASAQCSSDLPSGKTCGADDFFSEADPEACSMFYDCAEGCVDHKKCPLMPGNLPAVFDEIFEWCSYRDDVDCGSRPCTDAEACATQPPRTTTTTEPDCGHPHNCEEWGNGYFADPFNCRKYWHCYKGEGEHFICEDDPDSGTPEVFDEAYGGCNFQAQTDCGDRPICDECDENCFDAPTTPSGCNHPMDCTNIADGWYADDWNCRKYWHCSAGRGTHFQCDTSDSGEDLQYNPDKNWCDFDENVECGDRPVCNECDGDCHEDTTNIPDCSPDNHHPPTICQGKQDGWYPDLFNCAKYWHCVAEKGTHLMCATGLVYNSAEVQCDFPDRVDCGNRPTCDECDENCQ